jgi:lipopolysaccharide export system permease protein
MGGILFRMVMIELTRVFIVALIAITLILLLAGIVAEAGQHGLTPSQILAAIPLLIPSTLPYTIPATTLFAVCVVYGRLSQDNEILAIRAAGINVFTVISPGLVLGFAMSMMTMLLYFQIIPVTHAMLRALVFRDAEELLYSMLGKQGTLSHANLPFAMFVKGVQGRKLIHPTFKRRDSKGEIDLVAQAREADMRVNLAKGLLLVHMRHGTASFSDGSHGYFEDRVWDVPLPTNLSSEANKRARDMTWQEILQKKDEWEKAAEKTQAEWDTCSKSQAENPDKAQVEAHLKNLADRKKYEKQQSLFMDVELLMRPALSMGCLGFILVGAPIGVWFSKSDYLSAFISCFLPIVVIYYPLMLCGTGMAKEGKIDPFVLVWAADALMALVGGFFIWRLCRT